jgi:hypothetical protein
MSRRRPAACNEAATWLFSKPINSKGAPLYGTEISWQQPFDFLPVASANTGFTGNVTFVQATQTYFNTDGSVLTKADLTGLSHTSWSGTLYYDDTQFMLRATATYPQQVYSQWRRQSGQPQRLPDQHLDPQSRYGASYRIDDNFTVDVRRHQPDQPAQHPAGGFDRPAALLQPLYRHELLRWPARIPIEAAAANPFRGFGAGP